MSEGSEGWLVFFGLMGTMLAGVYIILSALRHRAQTLEMAHRERMAMIEKGLVPSPEMSRGHDAWANSPSTHLRVLHDRPTISSHRSLTLGIVIVAIGLGFMVLIGIAAETPSVAVGIGGAIAIVGVAFIVISLIKRMPSQMVNDPGMPMARHSAPVSQPSPMERPPDL
jgi:Domain of unknown function (DUF6249)